MAFGGEKMQQGETVSLAEANELIRKLDDCWTAEIRGDQDYACVEEMLEGLRPHHEAGLNLGDALHQQATYGLRMFKETPEGRFYAFVCGLGYAAELRFRVESGLLVPRTSELARNAEENVDAVWQLICRNGREKRQARARNGGRTKAEKSRFLEERSRVLKEIRAHVGCWRTKIEAAEALDAMLPTREPNEDRVARIKRWLSSDPELKAAFEEVRVK